MYLTLNTCIKAWQWFSRSRTLLSQVTGSIKKISQKRNLKKLPHRESIQECKGMMVGGGKDGMMVEERSLQLFILLSNSWEKERLRELKASKFKWAWESRLWAWVSADLGIRHHKHKSRFLHAWSNLSAYGLTWSRLSVDLMWADWPSAQINASRLKI